MAYSERMFLLLGIGLFFLGAGWFVMTRYPEWELPEMPQAVPADERAAEPEGDATPADEGEGATTITEESLPGAEAAATDAEAPDAVEDAAPAESAPPAPEASSAGDAPAPPESAPVVEAGALLEPEVADPAETVAEDGAEVSEPAAEVVFTQPDSGRDAPIEMIPVRAEPAEEPYATEAPTEPAASAPPTE